MKSLRESLFDDDLVTKELPTFGDMYKPVEISYSSTEDIQQVGDSFVLSRLKKDIKPLNLDGIDGYNEFAKQPDYLPCVLSKVNELPQEEKFISAERKCEYSSYDSQLNEMFGKYLKSNSKHSIYFEMTKWNWKPMLQIRKFGRVLYVVTIKYDVK